MNMNLFCGILIPFLGTTLGAACVFFMKNALGDQMQRALTGFAAGVMVAASIWSLLIPAIDQSSNLGKWSFVPAAAGFWIGILFLWYGYFRGVGRPHVSLILTVISLGTRVVLSYALAPNTPLGVVAIWCSIPVGWVLADVAGLVFYRRRRKMVSQ